MKSGHDKHIKNIKISPVYMVDSKKAPQCIKKSHHPPKVSITFILNIYLEKKEAFLHILLSNNPFLFLPFQKSVKVTAQ